MWFISERSCCRLIMITDIVRINNTGFGKFIPTLGQSRTRIPTVYKHLPWASPNLNIVGSLKSLLIKSRLENVSDNIWSCATHLAHFFQLMLTFLMFTLYVCSPRSVWAWCPLSRSSEALQWSMHASCIFVSYVVSIPSIYPFATMVYLSAMWTLDQVICPPIVKASYIYCIVNNMCPPPCYLVSHSYVLKVEIVIFVDNCVHPWLADIWKY